MKILKDTTENIQMENLDFKIKYSNISEINEVLTALDKMKTELSESLSKQWELEESRKDQIFKSEVKNILEFIFADEAALKRAIGNVISNAVEYCPKDGEILFSIDCNDKNVQFIIEDSGRGFTKEELASATEQFFQGDKSRNSKNHYGMGLYIATDIFNLKKFKI